MQNHLDEPYYFLLKDGDLAECYEFTSMKKPKVSRPEAKDGDGQMEAFETMGAVLGFTLLSAKMSGAPAKFDITLHEEETVPYPPVMYIYSLNGKLEMYYAFYDPWKDDDICREPRQLAR